MSFIDRTRAAIHAFTAPVQARGLVISQEEKANPVGPLTIPFLTNQEIAPPEGYEQMSREAYQLCAVAKAVTKRIARRTAQLPIKLQRHGAGGEWTDLDATEDDEHELMQLLRRPNKKMTRVDLFESCFASRILGGETFMLPFTGIENKPKELWWTIPNRWECKPGEDGLVDTWTYKVNGSEKPFDMRPSYRDGGPMAPVFFWKTFHPTDEWRGIGELAAGRLQLMQTNGAARWNANIIANNMRPPGVLKYEPADGIGKTLGRSQRATVEDEVRNKLTGPRAAGTPLILDGGWSWEDMTVSPKDLDWLAGQQYADRTICFLLGYPPIMLGIPGDATYKNYSEARTSFYQDTAMPLMREFLEQLNEWLVPPFGDDLRLVLDEEKIDALGEQRATYRKSVEESTVMTINEKREALGMDPVKDPLADEIWLPTSLAPLTEAGAPEEEIDPETGEPKPKKPSNADPDSDEAEDSKVPVKKSQDEGFNAGMLKLGRLARRLGTITTRKKD